jgi:hypothetical protein
MKYKTMNENKLENARGYRNRVLLLFLTFFFAPFGIPRMYMGCWWSGLVLMGIALMSLCLVGVTVSFYDAKNNYSKGMVVFSFLVWAVWGAWVLWDTIVVFLAMLTRSDLAPVTFCRMRFKELVYEDSPTDKNVAFGITVFFLLFYIATTIATGASISHSSI